MMIKFTEEDREFINEYFDEAYDMLHMYDIEGVLVTIARLIAAYGYDEEYDMNELGEAAQIVYTRIYDNNRELIEH